MSTSENNNNEPTHNDNIIAQLSDETIDVMNRLTSTSIGTPKAKHSTQAVKPPGSGVKLSSSENYPKENGSTNSQIVFTTNAVTLESATFNNSEMRGFLDYLRLQLVNSRDVEFTKLCHPNALGRINQALLANKKIGDEEFDTHSWLIEWDLAKVLTILDELYPKDESLKDLDPYATFIKEISKLSFYVNIS